MTRPLTPEEEIHNAKNPSYENDHNSKIFPNPSWPIAGVEWLAIYPEGIRKLLNWIKNEFNNPEIIITENGVCVSPADKIDDEQRVNYYKLYLNEVLKAIKIDNCNVKGYLAWCLMDGFEWSQGYTILFGLYKVDFKNDPERKRIPKKSAKLIENVFKNYNFEFLKD